MENSKKTMKGLLLISAGIDSPVAGWLMLKQGMELAGIHFSRDSESAPLRLLKKIGVKKCYIIQHWKFMEHLKKCNARYTCLLCRRTMFRIAEKIAQKEGYNYLVTGENLGQVASQTLDNLTACNKAVKINIFRPVLCNDKVETINLAKKIGTYDVSTEPTEKCPFLPKYPATRASVEEIEQEEQNLDTDKMVKEAVKSAKLIHL